MSQSTPPNGGRRGRAGAGEPRDALSRANGGRVLTTYGSSITLGGRLRVDPSRNMKAVTAEIGGLLEGIQEDLRHRSALLASELIAQVVGRAPEWNQQEIGLSIELRAEAIRLEASGPVLPAIKANDHNGVAHDALADWGTFVIARLADRWGTGRGSHRYVWAEIAIPA